MWIQVRSMDGKKCVRVDGLSKLTKIEELRKMLVERFDAPVAQQRLFFRGKQLEDGHSLFDYNVGLNEIVQIIVKKLNLGASNQEVDKENEVESLKNNGSEKNKLNLGASPPDQATASNQKVDKENEDESLKNNGSDNKSSSKYFMVGARVDAKDLTYGAWFEAKIISIQMVNAGDEPVLQSREKNDQSPVKSDSDCKVKDDGFTYRVVFEDYEDCEDPVDLTLQNIRPMARKLIKFEDVNKGDRVMVNYNLDEPTKRGFWYDCTVTGHKIGKTSKHLIGTITFGADQAQLENCKIIFTDEIMAIEKNSFSEQSLDPNEDLVTRKTMVKCSHCKDIPTKKCKICNCNVCGGKDAPDKQIMCDECDQAYHLWCLSPPLTKIPEEDEWYCPKCKNDETEVVRAGEKLKLSKKKSKMPSATATTSRDWGKGMACAGRTKECTLVPPNHFGPIPGVEVGTLWKFRVQVSESGVHRPPVSGIHGREGEGAYSLVLSGGYEDDLDEGEEFKYTGSGGRDLSGNKRCAEQSCDQTLTRMNKALASNCNAKLNKDGTEASDWKKGKPVRVVRNCKGKKHSEYSPEEGNRYDGIYKVIKYWPEKGKSGFMVWRYLLRRDDPTPAPWTKAGKKRSKELGLTMQYPDGYLESLAEKEKAAASEDTTEKKRKKKIQSVDASPLPKKQKTSAYAVSTEVQNLIEQDTLNKKLWDECLKLVTEGSRVFLQKVEETFSCVCCLEVVLNPITTSCSHNICKACLERSFKAKVFNCSMCRQELDKNSINQRNTFLQKTLISLFPGYDAGR